MDFLLVLNYVLYAQLSLQFIVRSDQGGSRNLFEIKNENRYSNVTFAFDDIRFSAHKGPSNPKHNVESFSTYP